MKYYYIDAHEINGGVSRTWSYKLEIQRDEKFNQLHDDWKHRRYLCIERYSKREAEVPVDNQQDSIPPFLNGKTHERRLKQTIERYQWTCQLKRELDYAKSISFLATGAAICIFGIPFMMLALPILGLYGLWSLFNGRKF